jgi:hypothetical protein
MLFPQIIYQPVEGIVVIEVATRDLILKLRSFGPDHRALWLQLQRNSIRPAR